MSKDIKETSSSGAEAWYAYDGPESDVILSTRVRLARNLANFPFTTRFRGDDSSRVQTLVFDSFSQCEDSDSYQAIAVSRLDKLGREILKERGVIEESCVKGADTGLVMRVDGKLTCTVNDVDHVRLSSFVPGLDGDAAYNTCKEMDDNLQKYLQFAASYDFGFLTAKLTDAGSGMKASCRVHLPSITFTKGIPSLYNFLRAKNIELSAVFGPGEEIGSSLGSYYQLSTINASCGSEFDQMANLISSAKYVLESERRLREQCLNEQKTIVLDKVYRSYAVMKFASLISHREAVSIISDLKWGKSLGRVDGVKESELHALLYRIQDGHLNYVLNNGKFSFPSEIEQNHKLMTQRLRSVILQEVFENISIR